MNINFRFTVSRAYNNTIFPWDTIKFSQFFGANVMHIAINFTVNKSRMKYVSYRHYHALFLLVIPPAS